jgi:hypothetical protein
MDKDFDSKISLQLKGYEKTINNLRLRGLMKKTEGKQKISFVGYETISKKLFLATPTKGLTWTNIIFAWAFSQFLWNLMSRPENIDTLMFQHITWEDDSLVVEEQGHKADQSGKQKYGKHCYDNANNIHVNLILALAFIVFCGDHREANRLRLFEGTNCKDRFNECLYRIFEGLSDEEQHRIGCIREDLGSYSYRKGSSSYSNGFAGLVSWSQIQMRMGHSLGKLNDCYISAEAQADFILGKVVAGRIGLEFAMLPPHFDLATLELLDESFWKEIVPGYDNFPETFKPTFPFLLATVINKEVELRSILVSHHPLWSSPIFSRNRHLQLLRTKTLTGEMKCANTGLIASGVPRDVIIAHEVKTVGQQVVGIATQLEEMPALIAEQTLTRIREEISISGLQSVTLNDIRVLLAENNALANSRSDTVPVPSATSHPYQVQEMTWWHQWTWNDGQLYHCVPLGWRFPRGITLTRLCILWYVGNMADNIRPYRLISRKHDIITKDQMHHTRAGKVTEEISKYINGEFGESLLLPNERILNLSIERLDTVLSCAIRLLFEKILSPQQLSWRPQDIKYGTVYNIIVDKEEVTKTGKPKKRLRPADSEDE